MIEEQRVDFIIWYSNQVPCLVDACKIPFDYMPNLSTSSNYGNIFYKLDVCCDISEKNGLILFIYGTVINHNRNFMHVKYTLAADAYNNRVRLCNYGNF